MRRIARTSVVEDEESAIDDDCETSSLKSKDEDESDDNDNDDSDCRCCCGISVSSVALFSLLLIVGLLFLPSQPSQGVEKTDLVMKYDTLSSLVQFTNSLLWSSATAGETMHQAIGYPEADPTKLDAVVVHEALRRLNMGCGSARRATTRVFDAGCGWGGTSFAIEKALQAEAARASSSPSSPPLLLSDTMAVHIDAVSISPVQVVKATQLARDRRVDSRIHFHVRSFDDVGHLRTGAPEDSSKAAEDTYDLAVAIESLVHSRDVHRTLAAIGKALTPTDATTCRAAHLLIVEDVLVGSEPITGIEAAVDPLLRDYRTHWAGWSNSPFPFTEQQWRATLSSNVGVLDGGRATEGEAAHEAASPSSKSSSTRSILHEELDLTITDLGATYGLRLHEDVALRGLHGALSFLYALVKPIAVAGVVPVVPAAAESYLSSYIGAIARERLLVAGRIHYGLIGASKDTTPLSAEEIEELR